VIEGLNLTNGIYEEAKMYHCRRWSSDNGPYRTLC